MRTRRRSPGRNALSAILAAGALLASGSALAAPDAGAILAHTCAGCHGTNGASLGAAPSIGGLPEGYLASTMAAYKDGTRYSTIMTRIAKGYSPEEIQAMSKYLAAQPWVPGTQDVDATLADRGKEVHNANGCAGCHGPAGLSPMPTTPRMDGQYWQYLDVQMRDYKDSGKTIPPGAMVMRSMLGNVSAEDIKALAHFYARGK